MRASMVVVSVLLLLALGCPAPCDRSTCTGCCDSTGQCLAGTSRTYCGGGGVVCQSCGNARRCVASACVEVVDAGSPDAGSGCVCPRGCCADLSCQPGNLPEACGADGGACVSCAPGARCESGRCVETTCVGCIDAVGTCQAGADRLNCGRGGALCQACAPTENCTGRSCAAPVCTPQTCTQGCCLGGMCMTPSRSACGIRGSSCTTCTDSQSCVNGVCR